MTTSVNPVQIASKAEKSLTYDDSLTPSNAMESTGVAAGNDNDLDDTTNNLISVLRNLKGSADWFTDFDDGTFSTRDLATVGTDLNAVETKDFLFNRLVLVDVGTFTSALRILTDPTETPSVLAAVTSGTEGAVCTPSANFATARTAGVAVIAGDLFSTGEPQALRPLNLGACFNGATGDPVVTVGGNQMKVLLITERATDGAFGNVASTDRGAIVFVEINATNDGYVYGDFNDLPASINYTYTERSEFLNLNEWAFLNEPAADAVAGTDVTLTLARTNQSGPVLPNNLDTDWQLGDANDFRFEDDGNATIAAFAVSAGGVRSVTLGTAAGSDVTTIEGTTLDINVSGDVTIASGLIIEDGGNPDMNFGVTAGQIDIASGTLTVTGSSGLNLAAGASGPVNIDSVAGAVSVDSITSSNFTITANSAGNQTMTLAGTNAGVGTANLAVSYDGTVDVQAVSTVTIDSSSSSIGIGTDDDAGGINIGTNTTARAIAIGNGAAAHVIEMGSLTLAASTAIRSGTAGTSIDSTGAVSITADAASNFQVDGAALQLITTGAFELDITSGGLLDMNAAAGWDVDVTGSWAMDATASMSIDANAISNITVTGGDLIVGTTTSGQMEFNSAECLLSSVADFGIGHQRRAMKYHYFGRAHTTEPNYVTMNAQLNGTNVRGGMVVCNSANTYTPGNTVSATTATTISVDAGAPTIADDTYIIIVGSNNECVNGFYQVDSTVDGTMTIRSTPDDEFVKGELPVDGSATGSIFIADLCIIRCNASGNWEVGDGTVGPIVFTELGTVGGTSLNAAYIVGPAITHTDVTGSLTLDNTDGDVGDMAVFTHTATSLDVQNILVLTTTNAFSGGEALTINNAGVGTGLAVDTTGTGPAVDFMDGGTTVFTIGATGNIDMDATATSSITMDVSGVAGDITATSAAGDFIATAAVNAQLIADGFEAGDVTVWATATNSGTGASDGAIANFITDADGASGATLSTINIQARATSATAVRAINVGTEAEEITVTSGNSTAATALVDLAGSGGISGTSLSSFAGAVVNTNVATNILDAGTAEALNSLIADATGAAAATIATVTSHATADSPLGTTTYNLQSDASNDAASVMNIAVQAGVASNAVNVATAAAPATLIFGNVTGATGITNNVGTGDFTVNTASTGNVDVNGTNSGFFDFVTDSNFTVDGTGAGSTISLNVNVTNDSTTGSSEAFADFGAAATGASGATIGTVTSYASTTSSAGAATYNLQSPPIAAGSSTLTISDSTTTTSNTTAISTTATVAADIDVGNTNTGTALDLAAGSQTVSIHPREWIATNSFVDRNGATSPAVVRTESTFVSFENGLSEGGLTVGFNSAYTSAVGASTYQVTVVAGSATTDTATAVVNGGADVDASWTTSGSGTFAAGSYVTATTGAVELNRGHVFLVVSHIGNTLLTEGTPVGDTAWCAGQVEDQSSASITLTNVTVSVQRVDGSGDYAIAEGSTDGGTIVFVDIGSNVATLENAFANNTGVTTALNTSFVGTVDDGDTFTVQSTTGGHTLWSAAAVNLADVVTIGANADANVVNFLAGTGGVNADTSGPVSLDSTALTSNFTQTVPTGTPVLTFTIANASTSGDASTLNIGVDSSGASGAQLSEINISPTVTSATGLAALNLAITGEADINVGTGAFASNIDIGNVTGATGVTINTGTDGIDVNTTGIGAIDLNSTNAITADAAATSNFSTSSGTLTFANTSATGTDDIDIEVTAGDVNTTATAGDVNTTATAGNVNLTATAGTVEGNGTVTVLTVTNVDVDDTDITGVNELTSTNDFRNNGPALGNLYSHWGVGTGGYTGTSGTTNGDFYVNFLETLTVTAPVQFTAGTFPTTNATLEVTGGGGAALAAGDVIVVQGAANRLNNGVYEIESMSVDTATLKGLLTARTFEFSGTQLVTDTSTVGVVAVVNFSALRTSTAGVFEIIEGGSDDTATWVNASVSSLSSAYANVGTTPVTMSGSFNSRTTDGDTREWSTVTGTNNLLSLAAVNLADAVTVLDNEAGSTFTSNAAINVVTTGISIDGGTAANEFTIGLTSAGGTANAIETPAGSLTIGSSNTAPGGSDTTVRTADTGGAGVTGDIAVFAGVNSNSGTSGGTVLVHGSDYSAASDVVNGAGDVTVRAGNDLAGNLVTGANVTVRAGIAATTGGIATLAGGAAFAAGGGAGGDGNVNAGAGDGAGLDGDVNIGVTNANDVNIAAVAEVDVTAALIDLNSTGAITANAGAASNFTTSAGAITVDAEAAALTLDAGAGTLAVQNTGEGFDVNISTANRTASGAVGQFDVTTGDAAGTGSDQGGIIDLNAGKGALGLAQAGPVNAGVGGTLIGIGGDGGDATGDPVVAQGSNGGIGGTTGFAAGNGGAGSTGVGVGLAGTGGTWTASGGIGGLGEGGAAGSDVAADGGDGGTATTTGGRGGSGDTGVLNSAAGGNGGNSATTGGLGGSGVAAALAGDGGWSVHTGGASGTDGGGGDGTPGIVQFRTTAQSIVTGVNEITRTTNQGAGANTGGNVSVYVYDSTSALATPTHAAFPGSLSYNRTSNGSDLARLYMNNGNGISTTTTTDWVEVLTTATGVTRGYFEDTFNTTITSGDTITTGEMTLGALPAKPTISFTFALDAEFFLNGVRLVAGAAASGEDVEDAAGDTFVLNQNASSGDQLIAVYNTGTSAL